MDASCLHGDCLPAAERREPARGSAAQNDNNIIVSAPPKASTRRCQNRVQDNTHDSGERKRNARKNAKDFGDPSAVTELSPRDPLPEGRRQRARESHFAMA